MPEIHLTIGGVVADSISNLPTIRIGANTQLELRFGEGTDLAFGNQVFDSPEERHEDLYEIVRWANNATIKVDRSSDGISHYRETVPGRAPVESFIQPVRTADGLTRMPDFWAAIRGGEDTREPGVGRTSLRLDVTVLALLDEFDTRDELKTALGAPVI